MSGNNDFHVSNFPRARKSYRCACCHGVIQKGQVHLKVAQKYDGDFTSDRIHKSCGTFWLKMYRELEPYDGMPYSLVEVMTDHVDDPWDAQIVLNQYRGFYPHTITRIEFLLRNWLAGADCEVEA